MKTKSLPILRYDLEVCPANASGISLLDSLSNVYDIVSFLPSFRTLGHQRTVAPISCDRVLTHDWTPWWRLVECRRRSAWSRSDVDDPTVSSIQLAGAFRIGWGLGEGFLPLFEGHPSGPRMGSLKIRQRTYYWLSTETIALNCLVFFTTNKQTDKQKDITIA